MVKEEVSTA